MAFVNELVSKEDIGKYGLVALCDSYRGDDHKYTAVNDPHSVMGIDWTIDRERESWLLSVASVTNPNYRLPSATQERIFVLHYLGVNIEVRLWSEPISLDTKEIPFRAGWKYLGMNPSSIEGANEEELKGIVKEAIQTYKQLGLRGRRTEVTEITFFDFERAE